ncbi:MAG: type II toxin-antitoxin system RelE/ParE family toxin [Candidatus Nanohalobium sp.]
MRRSGAEYVKSPLLEADPEDYDLHELASEIEDELRSLASGEYNPEVTNENIQHYSFEDSTQNRNPGWWRPEVTVRLDQEDETVEDWMNTVVSELSGNENYTLVTEDYSKDNLTGEEAPVYVKIGDYEQINETVTLEIPGEERPSFTTERDGFDVRVDPDLSAGFFQTNVEVGPDEHSSEVWMPYADSEKAILIGTPSQFSPDTESSVVSVPDDSFTGDPMTDAVAESLGYFLPFEGLQQTEISSEAVDHRNENPLGNEPYSVQVRSDAWDKFKDLDPEYQQRVQDKIDQVAINPGKSPLEVRDAGKVDQVGSNDIYVMWREHDQSSTVELRDIMTRDEAFVNKGDQNSRT